MQFNQNATIFSADSKEVGHLERVVIDPATKALTHIVIRKGLLNAKDKVIPVDMISAAVPDSIGLRLTADRLDELSDYEETRYSQGSDGWSGPAMQGASGYMDNPNTPMTTAPTLKEKVINIPPNTVALKEGAQVNTADGKHIGKLEQVLTSPESGQVTHLRISHGVLRKESKLIDALWIDTIEEKTVTLNTDSATVEQLPDYDHP
jgi:sporulation protein YlmC with PRC-barrel domain